MIYNQTSLAVKIVNYYWNIKFKPLRNITHFCEFDFVASVFRRFAFIPLCLFFSQNKMI